MDKRESFRKGTGGSSISSGWGSVIVYEQNTDTSENKEGVVKNK